MKERDIFCLSLRRDKEMGNWRGMKKSHKFCFPKDRSANAKCDDQIKNSLILLVVNLSLPIRELPYVHLVITGSLFHIHRKWRKYHRKFLRNITISYFVFDTLHLVIPQSQ